jgi:hypothetical protein
MYLERPAQSDRTAGGVIAPVFLHTGWRSRGTWIWSALRGEPRTMAFYEPLHEWMATLTPERVAAARSDTWPSGHPLIAPYLQEYAALLRRGVPGVPGYQPDFAVEHAFADPAEPRPELAAYLKGLLRHAATFGRVAVLKFCRSMGRVGWMRANFPDALHAVVLRRPDAQWASARRQMEQHGNPYFVAMPLAMLARNAAAPLVALACRALRVPLPRVRAAAAEELTGTCGRLVEQLSWEDRYRTFLAHWLAGALVALATDCLVVDADMLLWSAYYRREMTAAVAEASGLRLALPVESARRVLTPPLGREELAIQQVALEVLEQHRTALLPSGYMLAWNMLASALAHPGAVAAHQVIGEAVEEPPPRPGFRMPWSRVADSVGGD